MRLLFLTHRLPYAPNRGDRIRAYHIAATSCEAQESRGALVSLAHDGEETRRRSGDWPHGATR